MIKRYWLKFWKNLGFSLPSSRFLTRRMISFIQKEKTPLSIVELWAGKWPLTGVLIESFPDANIASFEIEDDAFLSLETRYGWCQWLTLYHESATEVEKHFSPNSVDIIISTLPLGSISYEWVEHILMSAQKVLKKNGQFLQYQYWMANKSQVKKYFHMEKLAFEPRNFGPAWIYVCRKK